MLKNLKMLIIILIIFAIGMSIALVTLHVENKNISNSSNNTLNNKIENDYINNTAYRENLMKNIVKNFIELINAKKYTEAYALLEKNFRKENFPTEQDFINYIKTDWFENNIISSREITENGTVLVNIRKTLSTQSTKMQKEFLVNLEENENFAIEFKI